MIAQFYNQSSVIGQGNNICMEVDPNPIGELNGNGHNYFRNKNPYELVSKAAFGEVYWEAAQDLKITAGLRYTNDRKVFTPWRSQLLAPGSAYGPSPQIQQRWEELSGRLRPAEHQLLPRRPQSDFGDQQRSRLLRRPVRQRTAQRPALDLRYRGPVRLQALGRLGRGPALRLLPPGRQLVPRLQQGRRPAAGLGQRQPLAGHPQAGRRPDLRGLCQERLRQDADHRRLPELRLHGDDDQRLHPRSADHRGVGAQGLLIAATSSENFTPPASPAGGVLVFRPPASCAAPACRWPGAG